MFEITCPDRWSKEQANEWYARMPWLAGCNYTPRHAINQLEFWQKETFNPGQIDEELGWAAKLGFNSMRVFLHDLVWTQDGNAYLDRIDRFLGIADKHGIGAMFVFFDSCWYPVPRPGLQHGPEPGVHNSYWLQSPGYEILKDRQKFYALEPYVKAVVGHFRDDKRVHVWDLWNEPGNHSAAKYPGRDFAEHKADIVAPLMSRAFDWARSMKPTQPLTTGVFAGNWESEETLWLFERVQLAVSDVVSFHCYQPADKLEMKIRQLARYGRPLLCTEYLARSYGSTFQSCMPVMRKHNVAAYNWGFVAGKTQTHFPWDSWSKIYPADEPPMWHHEVMRANGRPYSEEEAQVIRSMCNRT